MESSSTARVHTFRGHPRGANNSLRSFVSRALIVNRNARRKNDFVPRALRSASYPCGFNSGARRYRHLQGKPKAVGGTRTSLKCKPCATCVCTCMYVPHRTYLYSIDRRCGAFGLWLRTVIFIRIYIYMCNVIRVWRLLTGQVYAIFRSRSFETAFTCILCWLAGRRTGEIDGRRRRSSARYSSDELYNPHAATRRFDRLDPIEK
jgi:hypothetical protein